MLRFIGAGGALIYRRNHASRKRESLQAAVKYHKEPLNNNFERMAVRGYGGIAPST
jgi:hypothetical protein